MSFTDPFGDDFLFAFDPAAQAAEAAEADAFRETAAEAPQDEGGEFDPKSDAAFAAREAERATERESLYARLNERQAEAVNLGPVSALVLAGAGSGKTSVLTARMAKQISTGKTSAREVLAVTFTNKAAQEMTHRLSKLLDKRTLRDLWMGTFHSLCNKLLRENAEAAGLPKTFGILDKDGQESMVRGILKDFGLTKSAVKEAAKAKAVAAKADLLTLSAPNADLALAAAGGLAAEDVEDEGDKNEFVTSKQCTRYISSRKEALKAPEPPASLSTLSSDVEQMEAVYAEYQIRCRNNGLLDFQDLLTRGVELLEQNPDIRDGYQRRFKMILVDEFQDTNDLQYRWLQLMKGAQAYVMAVGDDSQSIYGFRGANPANMQRFVDEMTVNKDAAEGRVVKLEQNYRSLPHILEAANAIIDRNPGQLKKTLFTTQRDRGERIDLTTFSNGMFEASSIADSIHDLLRNQGVPASEVAVLYRTNTQSRQIEQEMNKRGLPVTVYGGYRFYERQEIKNVLAYLDLVCDLTRDLSFARVVNFPPRSIGERTVEELRQDSQHKRISMFEAVSQRSATMATNPKAIGTVAAQKKQRQLESFANIILDLADDAQKMPLSELIDKLLDRAGIKNHYIEEAGDSKAGQEEAEERMANVGELMSAAKQFELDNPTLTCATDQLPEYLSYVALMTSTSESDMSKKQTVSLMTVHSSKGLEFDNVFLAGMEESIFPHSRAITEDEESGNGKSVDQALRDMGLTHDEEGAELGEDSEPQSAGDGEGIQEERRLMYVAVTRARKRLFLSLARERMLNGKPTECQPSRFISEIPSARLNYIDDAKRFANSKKGNLRSVDGAQRRSNDDREYGGDAYDNGRAGYKPMELKPLHQAPKAAPAPAAPAKRAELQTQTAFSQEHLVTDARLVGAGSVRVVSKRRGGTQAVPGETVIDADRGTVFGNEHVLADHNDDVARARVVAAAKADFDADCAVKGPMFQLAERIAVDVAGGAKIALQCWCAPRACHVDHIAARVATRAHEMLTAGTAKTAVTSTPRVAAPTPMAATPVAAVAAPPAPLKPWQIRGAAALQSASGSFQAPSAPLVTARAPQAAPLPAPAPSPSHSASGLTARPKLTLVAPPPWAASPEGRIIAVIGTAGRDKTKPMTGDLWERMLADARTRVRPTDTLVSGGAAWADHIAVALFLEGAVRHLVLHLPAPLVDGHFVGPRDSSASAANYYHDLFTKATKVNGREDIMRAIRMGATVTEQPSAPGYGAMFGRNHLVAKVANAGLAYTFGEAEQPADGGTKYTWDKIKGDRQHIPMLSLGPAATTPLPASSPGVARTLPGPQTMARLDVMTQRRYGRRP